MRLRFLAFVLPLFLLFVIPISAFAATATFFGPIVPEVCRQCPCGFGGVLAIIQNGINFLISIAIIFFVILLTWAGILYIFSSTNPESRSTANKMLTNAVIGMMIILSAWLIVDFVMKTLYGGQFGPWNSILYGTGNACVEAVQTKPLFSGNIFAVPGMSTNPGTNTGSVGTQGGCMGDGTNSGCVSLGPEVSCEARGCKADAGLKAALAGIKVSQGWTVTEGYPQSRSHRATCHQNGTCVDVAFRPKTYTADSVTAFVRSANAQGLRVVFETDDCSLRDAVRKMGVRAFCKADGGGYEAISGTHFSVYAN